MPGLTGPGLTGPGAAPEQVGITLVLMRAGTSRGLFLHERDLPGPGPERSALLRRLMGSPDVLQIDGLGGSRMITSKVAVIGPPTRPDADVDYTFAQIDPATGEVNVSGNCTTSPAESDPSRSTRDWSPPTRARRRFASTTPTPARCSSPR